jgi:hypothetical protein
MCSADFMYVPKTGTFTSSALANDHSSRPLPSVLGVACARAVCVIRGALRESV